MGETGKGCVRTALPAPKTTRNWWTLLADFAPYPDRRGKGGQTAKRQVPDPGRGASSGTEAPPQSLAPACLLICPPPPGTTGQPRPEAYRKAGPSPAVPRRVLQDRDRTGPGGPPLLGRARQLSRSAATSHFRARDKLHAGSQPRGKEGEAVIGLAKRARSRWRGVSRIGRGGASGAPRLTGHPGVWCCVLLLS